MRIEAGYCGDGKYHRWKVSVAFDFRDKKRDNLRVRKIFRSVEVLAEN